jgi:hypothetical protein
LHDASFNSYKRTIDFTENYFDPELTLSVEGHCLIFLDVYPSVTYADPYENSIPATFTIVIASLFVLMAIIFGVYNKYDFYSMRFQDQPHQFLTRFFSRFL